MNGMYRCSETGYDVYELYGKKFAFVPFFHKSKFTRNSADDEELRNVTVTATSQVCLVGLQNADDSAVLCYEIYKNAADCDCL